MSRTHLIMGEAGTGKSTYARCGLIVNVTPGAHSSPYPGSALMRRTASA